MFEKSYALARSALFVVGFLCAGLSCACTQSESTTDPAAAPGADGGPHPWAADAGADLGYPSPEAAGFHHLALVYKRAQDRRSSDFVPYVAWQKDGRPRAGQWLFDAFVFLAFKAPSGVALDYGASTQADWEALLDAWLGPRDSGARGEIGALDDAISATAAATSDEGRIMGAPPGPRRIALAMPWMNPEVTDFGDVDGDGTRENLARSEDRARVAKWYAAQVRERFRARHYAHVESWGLYFMREDIVHEDAVSLPSVTRAVHGEGLRMLFIPYYAAPGWDAWRGLGFDVAILQPSYAFRSWIDGGRVTRSRLAAAADFARTKGLGVEVEVRGTTSIPAERTMLRQYLADGARARRGYQQGATVYFLGDDIVEKSTTDPDAHAAYEDLAAYVRGATLADPDPASTFAWTASQDGRTTSAQARLARPLDVRALHIDLDEPPASGTWLGTAHVRVRRAGSSSWEPAGWALRTAPDRVSGTTRWQSLTIPLASAGLAPIAELALDLVTAKSSPAARAPMNAHIALDSDFPPQSDAPLARGAEYVTRPGPPASMLPDSAPGTRPKLTDGLVSEGGWNSGRNIGWRGDPGELAVVFDLGQVRAFTRAKIWTHGGSDAAVNWPLNPALLLAIDAARVAPNGIGALPPDFAALAGSEPVVTGKHGPHCTPADAFAFCTNLDGYIDVAPPGPIRTRYVTVFTEAKGWVMLNEVQIEADGMSMANVPYTIRTFPSPEVAPDYMDNGRKLTDGTVATSFIPALLSGWSAATNVQVDVNLTGATPLQEVTVWSQSLGSYGIDPPATVRIEVAGDGGTFSLLGEAKAASAVVLEGARGYRVRSTPPVPARRVRISVPAHSGADRWTMLSEIDVR
ncbi:DUF4855 domain-containing protein [Pendulispora albinea]|uniref:DUF4855 domain-containing protein n=1 Tax=Pendulispora albinea TaxID=2741071 RepID=A0ABZ2M410_9BACT